MSTNVSVAGSPVELKTMDKSWASLGRVALKSALIATFLFTSTVEAGEVLELQIGKVDPAENGMQYARGKRNRVSTSRRENYFVVQFHQAVTQLDRQNIVTLGADIVRYLPQDALVIRSTERVAGTISVSSPRVRVVAPYRAEWKLSPEMPAGSVFNAKKTNVHLIRLFPGEISKRQQESARRQIAKISGVKIEDYSGRTILARVPVSRLEAVSKVSAVEWIQIAPEIETHLFPIDEENQARASRSSDYSDITGYESGTRLMGFDAAWARGLTGRGQVTSMADTGLDRGDLTNIHGDFTERVPMGFALGLFAKSWEDPMGHGSHVAGSISGSGAASSGLLKGGAFESKFVPVSLWSPMLDNLSMPTKLADVFAKPYDNGARIHNNSWGTPRDLGAYDGLAQQVDEFTFSHPDMLVIFAAGNSGVDADKDGRIDPGSVSSPGTAKNALTVGASKNYVLKGGIQKKLIELSIGKEKWGAEPLASSMLSENPNGLAPFSSRGPTKDGRLKPEIVAPGTNVLSTRSLHSKAQALWGIYNQDYLWAGGTSMAAPLTAGAAAVVRQYLIDQKSIHNPSAAILKAVLMHTAFDLFPGQFGERGKAAGQELLSRRPNVDQGYGRVDLERATQLDGAVIVDERRGVATGETHAYPIRLTKSSKVTVTLVYTDAPGAAAAARALVNDLDVALVDSSGRETAIGDRINNSEMIESFLGSGQIEVRVRGVNVPLGSANGKQSYALVISVD